MNRFTGRLGWAVATVAIVLLISQAAAAQREDGRRGRGRPDGRESGGGFGVPSLRLASLDEVQDALKLSDEEKKKIEEINDQLREDFRKLLQDGGRREEMQKLSRDAQAKLAEILDDEQQKRLMGISIQVMGASAAAVDPAVAEELSVTEEQKSKLAEIQQSNMRAMGEAFREMRDLSGEERRAKFEELREEAHKKLLAVLTTEQQEQLEALKGEPVDIDLSQLRGPGGRGGFEGQGRGSDRQRGRDRGDRNRDASRDKDASNSN